MLVCACGLLALSAVAAFAVDGGHGGHVSPVAPDTGSYKVILISSKDITVPAGVSLNSVASVAPSALTTLITGATFYVTDASKMPQLLGGLTLGLAHDAGVIANITIANTGLSGVSFAWIQDKANSKVFSRYNAVMDGGNIIIKDVPLDYHFSAAAILLGAEKAQPSSDSGSSSGCNAGAASMMLLFGAALPLLYFRKK